MLLNDLWFGLIAVLWIGYFVLDGFDFGVGGLLGVLGRDERGRRVLINTIGPVWDGNEVWLLVAGGATFAAFPQWYATLFSGFYLPLLAILVCLIIRAVAFEYRGKGHSDTWRRNWDWAIVACSVGPALLWGVAFGSIVRGVPLSSDHEFAGGVLDLLSPFAVLVGVTTLLLFLTHGAVFVALKTTEQVRERANRLAVRLGVSALVAMAGMVLWQSQLRFDPISMAAGTVAVLGLGLGLVAARRGRDGWAFAASAVATGLLVASWFTALYPAVLPSSTDPAGTLTIHNAASSPYTLTVMTWVAAIMTPVVLAYQGWTYWVFRRRISTRQIPPSQPAGQAEAQLDDRAATGAGPASA